MTGRARGAPRGRRPPVVGITAETYLARWDIWEERSAIVPENYIDHVSAAGGLPVLLPPVPGVEAAVAGLDALIIIGGPDVDPAGYAAAPDPRTTGVLPARDAAETALFRQALRERTPVLGICRGMQLMNVALGGTLIQHLPDLVGNDVHSPIPHAMGSHLVTVGSEGLVPAILGEGARLVPTNHHQGVARLGTGLSATAWAPDGTIEAVELAGHAFAVGVQWHPEAGTDPRLFQALIAAAAENATTRRDSVGNDRLPFPASPGTTEDEDTRRSACHRARARQAPRRNGHRSRPTTPPRRTDRLETTTRRGSPLNPPTTWSPPAARSPSRTKNSPTQ